MFEKIFDEIESKIADFKAISVVSMDGIEIESRIKEDLQHEVLSAEMNGILQHLKRLKDDVSIGLYEEVVIKTEKENICLIKINEEVFVLIVTGKSVPTGKVIYEVVRRIPDITKEL